MPTSRPGFPPADPYAAVPMSHSLRALARRGELIRRRKDQSLINEGDTGDTIYIILSGSLRAYSVGADDREVTFGKYGPGEYVGEMGLDGRPRSANVDALEPTLCSMVTRRTLQQHLAADPDFAFELLTKVIHRARAATIGLRQIALNSVYGRLKDHLYALARQQPGGELLIAPAPSQLELSQDLGCSREMITRVMGDLVRGGYVDSPKGKHRITILRTIPDKW